MHAAAVEAQLISPEVHSDGKVTFRTQAPNATSVRVKGIEGLDPQPMSEGPNGVWTATVGPLEPELYSYVFEVDGADIVDRHNRSLKRWFFLESLVEVPGDPPLPHEQWPVRHGAVTHHIYKSESTGTERGVFVYTPPGYRPDREDEYPVLFLLHGYGDDEGAWTEVGRAHFIADNLISEGRIGPAVIVMPYGHPEPVVPGLFPDEYRRANERAMEIDLMEDLLPFISRTYNVSNDRIDRAIAGLSMGGGQSLQIGLRHLDTFAWIGAFSAVAPVDDMDRNFAHLVDDVSMTNRQLRLLWLACGKDDSLLQPNDAFSEWLKRNNIDHTYDVTDGAHTWFVWRKYLAAFLEMIFSDS